MHRSPIPISFLHLFPLLLCLPAFSQGTDAEVTQDERAILQFVYDHCPNADILQIDRSESSYLEIEYLCEGKIVEMGIRANEVIFIERETDAGEVPRERIERSIEKRYPGSFIDEVSMLTVQDTSFLKVELIQDGIEHNMFFTTDGKIYKPRSSLVSEKWDMGTIAEIGIRGPAGYDLLSPDTIHELPPILREISGIAAVDEKKLLCVQDELGVVFEFDLRSGNITGIRRFTDLGDFEDITIKGDRILVLRSDGNIFSLGNDGAVKEMLVQLSTLNVEGLHFDPKSDRLFLASKEAAFGEPSTKRTIYEVDENGRAKPHLSIDITDLGRKFNERFPTLEAGNISFDPSAVAVHPITGELYVLSAADRLIAIFNSDLKDVFPLPAEIFFKPEGLAFFPDGTLLISSEGDKKGFNIPSIMLFRYKR